MLRTSAWYGDEPLRLSFPDDWHVQVLWPDTPPPLTEQELAERVDSPVGQERLSSLLKGKSRPVIIVDDLTRPTPVERVLPMVLAQMSAAGIAAEQVRILVATGAHGAPPAASLDRKVGAEAAARCKVLVHDCRDSGAKLGRTSYGSPVIVNREVADSDFLLGISGVYPQNSVGFGGGSKLLLGVLARRSIVHLHHRHSSVGESYNIDNPFRHELDEMARIVGLKTMISLHIDADRRIVRAVSGDHFAYYAEAARFSLERFAAPYPEQADVVISNAYPMDVSLTFAYLKGVKPLLYAQPDASRIMISANTEGLGHHRLFPFGRSKRRAVHFRRFRRLSIMGFSELSAEVLLRLRRARTAASPPLRPTGRDETRRYRNPICLYSPCPEPLPPSVGRARPLSDWSQILDAVREEQGNRRGLRVLIYPCAPIQCLG